MVPGYKVCFECQKCDDGCILITFVGEIRRPFRPIENDNAAFPMLPVLV